MKFLKKYKTSIAVHLITLALIIIPVTSLLQRGPTKSVEHEKPISLKIEGGAKGFKAGHDFPPGRYKLTSEGKDDTILFVRDSDNNKVLSIVLGSGKGSTSSYTVSLEKGWKVVPVYGGSQLKLTPLSQKSITLTPGDYTNMEDIQLKAGHYKAVSESGGYITIDGKTQELKGNKGVDIKLSETSTVRVTSTDLVKLHRVQ